MKIGDDWFTRAMLIQTLTGNKQLQAQLGEAGADFSSLFASVLNNLKMQMDAQSPVLQKRFADFSLLNDEVLRPNQFSSNIVDFTKNPVGTFRFQSVGADKIDQVLGGKLKGMGEAFIQAGKQYNVDPALLAAIAQHETGNGKSPAAIEKNNIAGMMGINGLKSYSSIEESIFDMTRNISKNYLGKGLATISEIAAKYAPVGAKNDPTGLNNHWVAGVTKFYNQLQV